MKKPIPLWRSTPPAIFPVCLGLLGLGLGWRSAADVLPIAHEFGDLLLGFSCTYYLYFLTFYFLKLSARPSVLFEDMTNPPARAGVAAAAMSMMLLAAALLPLGIPALYVQYIWWTGVILQIGASAIVCYAIWKDPPEQRQFTTFQYLTFVGPVVGPIAGIPLGYVWESILLTLAALVAYVIITIGNGLRLANKGLPVQLRPSLAIFLAPTCLFATSFGLLGIDWAFDLFYWLSGIIAFVLLLLFPWMVKGGWSPVWAAFTFPVSAFLQVQVMAAINGVGFLALVGVYSGLVLGTSLIAYVAYRSVMSWVTGELARKSGAAIA